MVDPFTQIHIAIWQTLIACPSWAAYVPPGARVTSVEVDVGRPANAQVPSLPLQPTIIKGPPVALADGPEVRIVQGGFTPRTAQSNSTTTFFEQVFIVQMCTPSKLLDLTPLNKLKWLTYAAIERGDDTLGLSGLVSGYRFSNSPEKSMIADDGPLKQWVGVMPIIVTFYYHSATLALI